MSTLDNYITQGSGEGSETFEVGREPVALVKAEESVGWKETGNVGLGWKGGLER